MFVSVYTFRFFLVKLDVAQESSFYSLLDSKHNTHERWPLSVENPWYHVKKLQKALIMKPHVFTQHIFLSYVPGIFLALEIQQ